MTGKISLPHPGLMLIIIILSISIIIVICYYACNKAFAVPTFLIV